MLTFFCFKFLVFQWADNLESGSEPRQPDEEPAAGSGAESDDDVLIARSLRKRKQLKSTELGQKFGVLAIVRADGEDAQSEEDDYCDPQPVKLKSPRKVP